MRWLWRAGAALPFVLLGAVLLHLALAQLERSLRTDRWTRPWVGYPEFLQVRVPIGNEHRWFLSLEPRSLVVAFMYLPYASVESTEPPGSMPADGAAHVCYLPMLIETKLAPGIVWISDGQSRGARISLWWIVLLFSAVSGLVAWRAIRRWRAATRKQCLGCGYDLRGSNGRCPECGRRSDMLDGLRGDAAFSTGR